MDQSTREPGPLQRMVSRRRMLQGSALAGVSAFLAACGGGLASPSPTQAPASATPGQSSAGPTPEPTPSPTLGGTLHWANWPAYIDLTGKAGDTGQYAPGSSPTIEQFQQQTGIKVDYQEKIEDNAHFFATIQPQLVAGLPTGWDLIVMTDWMAAKLISKGWIEKIDPAAVPNCVANVRDALKGQPWDPNMDYHYTWQSGMTGIGYSTKAFKTANIPALTSVADLFTVADSHAKNVSFLTESRDTFGLAMLKLGLDPAKVTVETLTQTHDAIAPLVGKGLRFADNSYLQDFAAGKTWAAMVWSGDLASSGGADDIFVFPSEGTMIWSDNMMIPKGATNVRAAEAMMNFVYEPQIAGQIANYVYYVSPVKGADAVVKQLNASSPLSPDIENLLFPSADIVAKQHAFQAPLPQDVEDTLNNLYIDLSGG
jgi:spermidine/putrescine transport system substrate-binding protein